MQMVAAQQQLVLVVPGALASTAMAAVVSLPQMCIAGRCGQADAVGSVVHEHFARPARPFCCCLVFCGVIMLVSGGALLV